MKKDKEWLIKRVENYIPLNDKTVGHVVDNILDIIHQLDEPEVLSQEWIDEHIDYADVGGDTSVYTCRRLKILLVPKRGLPVIPKHVGEWITRYREKYDLYPALRLLENNTLVWGEIYEWYRMNTRKFVNAYLTGEYEVEEEQKYYVNLDTAAYVAKWNGDGQVDIYTDGISGSVEHEFHLTEQEIKNYDERFWPFAEPVE